MDKSRTFSQEDAKPYTQKNTMIRLEVTALQPKAPTEPVVSTIDTFLYFVSLSQIFLLCSPAPSLLPWSLFNKVISIFFMVFVFFCDNTAHVFPGSVLTILDAEMWKKYIIFKIICIFAFSFERFRKPSGEEACLLSRGEKTST